MKQEKTLKNYRMVLLLPSGQEYAQGIRAENKQRVVAMGSMLARSHNAKYLRTEDMPDDDHVGKEIGYDKL
jgi:hypothetical protein